MRRIDRHAATALALAGVLAGAAVVAALAAALALARVLARALVLGLRGAAALALAGVLAGASAVAALAAALALARVMAFTDVVFAARFLAGVRHLCELGASQEAADHAQHHLAEITTIHSHVIPLMSETDPLSSSTVSQETEPLAGLLRRADKIGCPVVRCNTRAGCPVELST